MAIDDVMGGGRGRRPEMGGPRRSGARAIVFWTLALLAGGSAALLLRWYMDRSAVPVAAPLAKVVVAAKDLPVATNLKADDLKLADWPERAQPPGIFRDPKEVIGRVITTRVVMGEPILAAKLADKDGGRGLAALIPASMRAVAVHVDEVVGVAGFVHPEDRVDVVVTMRPPKPSDSEITSKVMLQNVKVLAVGRQLDTSEGGGRNRAVPVTVATLLVTPEESEKLALVSNSARILLSLRSWTDTVPVDTPGATATALFAGVDVTGRARLVASTPAPTSSESSRRSRPRREEPAPAPTVAPPVNTASQPEVVEILRGDRFEERKFDAKDKK